jgi:hypothetical protein
MSPRLTEYVTEVPLFFESKMLASPFEQKRVGSQADGGIFLAIYRYISQ